VALIGVFGLNLSPKSGGVFYLINGLMETAHFSEHEYIYICERDKSVGFPKNVQLVSRPRIIRLLTQCLFRLPMNNHVFKNRLGAIAGLSAVSAISPSVYRHADAWLWPHCFAPVPHLKNMVAICHDMIHAYYPECFSSDALSRRRKGEASLRHCARVICPSQATKRDLLRRYPEYQFKTKTFSEAACEVIPIDECSAEVSALKRSFGGFLLFIFIAVDWPHKNHELLIKAAKQLQSMTDRPFKVVFIGHRRSNMLQRMIQEYNVQNLVVDVGNISRKLLVAYYHTATAFLFPSLCEGFGIPLVEAMHCSLPIIASDRSCIPEVCGNCGTLLPPDRPELWARQMLRIMVDERHRQEQVILSLKQSSQFSWERTWNKIDRVFDEILG